MSSQAPKYGWKFFDTHSGYEKTTQDFLLCFVGIGRGCADIIRFPAVGLVLELMGQDATSCPDKTHKAKFIRDLVRIIKLRGECFPLYGIITDLARITVIKVIGMKGLFPNMQCYTGAGNDVQEILTAFTTALPSDLGVLEKELCFESSELQRSANVKSVIAAGAHGVVYSDCNDANNVIKKFRSESFYLSEIAALTDLAAINGIPRLIFFDNRKFACILQPFGTVLKKKIREEQCTLYRNSMVLHFALSLVKILQSVHSLKKVHRDVRASNIIIKDNVVFLIDWASCVDAHQLVHFSGTIHFAALEILLALSKGVTTVEACPKHDLESRL